MSGDVDECAGYVAKAIAASYSVALVDAVPYEPYAPVYDSESGTAEAYDPG